MKKLKDLLKDQQELFDGTRYVTREYQDFGYRLALKLDDLEHKALYIKLAKEEPRGMLERALSFTVDYPHARNKAKIFMWKLKELREEWEKKGKKVGEGDGPENGENGDVEGVDSDNSDSSDKTNSDNSGKDDSGDSDIPDKTSSDNSNSDREESSGKERK